MQHLGQGAGEASRPYGHRLPFELEGRGPMRREHSLGWTHSRALPLLDEQGAIIEWIGAATDVTQRRQAEGARRESGPS